MPLGVPIQLTGLEQFWDEHVHVDAQLQLNLHLFQALLSEHPIQYAPQRSTRAPKDANKRRIWDITFSGSPQFDRAYYFCVQTSSA